MKHIRSFLKWAGGKYNCLNNILPSLPNSSTLIEPFTGSATIFMNTNYDFNILAEANPDLVNIFLQIQENGAEFINYCESFFINSNNDNLKYYQLREKFNNTTNKSERAAIFLYLNRHGFNGLCRYNSQGIYNVPFGKYLKPYFPKNEMLLFYKKSKIAKFLHCDYLETFALAKPGDFIYCDPPYSPIQQKSNFSQYTKNIFTENDHLNLAKAAKEAASSGIRVIISNHDTDFTREQYKDAEIKYFKVARNISRNYYQRKPTNELIAIY